MNKSIFRNARKFITKDLKRNLDFESVEKYLNKIGYIVLFYDESESSEIIQKYDLVEYSKSCNAFTINDEHIKVVFINTKLSSQDMLYAVLHEVGHILLKHLDCRTVTANRNLQEIEADAFVYEVLKYTDRRYIFLLLIACMAMLGIFIGTIITNDADNTIPQPTVSIKETVATSVPTAAPTIAAENQSDIVYVTPSGTKYHRSDCRYVKNKNCSTYTRAEAEKKYSACSVCRP